MSNILENLQKILSSVYGKDVRQAIHDSIRDCYEDGKVGATDLIAREGLNTKATKTELEVERQRINGIIALPSGSTTGDAELHDIRVATDGVTYNSAGDAVRKQVNDVNKSIIKVDEKYETTNRIILDGNVSIKPESLGDWELGYIKPDGTKQNSDQFIRTKEYIDMSYIEYIDDYSISALLNSDIRQGMFFYDENYSLIYNTSVSSSLKIESSQIIGAKWFKITSRYNPQVPITSDEMIVNLINTLTITLECKVKDVEDAHENGIISSFYNLALADMLKFKKGECIFHNYNDEGLGDTTDVDAITKPYMIDTVFNKSINIHVGIKDNKSIKTIVINNPTSTKIEVINYNGDKLLSTSIMGTIDQVQVEVLEERINVYALKNIIGTCFVKAESNICNYSVDDGSMCKMFNVFQIQSFKHFDVSPQFDKQMSFTSNNFIRSIHQAETNHKISYAQGKFSNNAVKFDLKYEDLAGELGHRQEIVLNTSINAFFNHPLNTKIFDFDVKFGDSATDYEPDSYEGTPAYEIFMQLHDTPDVSSLSISPPIALVTENDKIRLKIAIYDDDIGSYTINEFYDVADIKKGEWQHITLFIKEGYKTEHGGFVAVYVDGELGCLVKGVTTTKRKNGTYMKFGIYKAIWNTRPTVVNERKIYFDNMTLYN